MPVKEYDNRCKKHIEYTYGIDRYLNLSNVFNWNKSNTQIDYLYAACNDHGI